MIASDEGVANFKSSNRIERLSIFSTFSFTSAGRILFLFLLYVLVKIEGDRISWENIRGFYRNINGF